MPDVSPVDAGIAAVWAMGLAAVGIVDSNAVAVAAAGAAAVVSQDDEGSLIGEGARAIGNATRAAYIVAADIDKKFEIGWTLRAINSLAADRLRDKVPGIAPLPPPPPSPSERLSTAAKARWSSLSESVVRFRQENSESVAIAIDRAASGLRGGVRTASHACSDTCAALASKRALVAAAALCVVAAVVAGVGLDSTSASLGVATYLVQVRSLSVDGLSGLASGLGQVQSLSVDGVLYAIAAIKLGIARFLLRVSAPIVAAAA